MFVLCVLYSKDKKDKNQDKEVWIKYKERKKIKKFPMGSLGFLIDSNFRAALWPWGPLSL
jgi:hypothetical protein